MSWPDRIYLAVVALASVLSVTAAVADPDPYRLLSSILFSVWLIAILMRMRAQRHFGRL